MCYVSCKMKTYLYESSCRVPAFLKMFLPMLLLNFKSQTRTQNTLQRKPITHNYFCIQESLDIKCWDIWTQKQVFVFSCKNFLKNPRLEKDAIFYWISFVLFSTILLSQPDDMWTCIASKENNNKCGPSICICISYWLICFCIWKRRHSQKKKEKKREKKSEQGNQYQLNKIKCHIYS